MIFLDVHKILLRSMKELRAINRVFKINEGLLVEKTLCLNIALSAISIVLKEQIVLYKREIEQEFMDHQTVEAEVEQEMVQMLEKDDKNSKHLGALV